jgi:hypothetical protein
MVVLLPRDLILYHPDGMSILRCLTVTILGCLCSFAIVVKCW